MKPNLEKYEEKALPVLRRAENLPIFANVKFDVSIKFLILFLVFFCACSLVTAFGFVKIHAVVVHKLTFAHKLVSG